ncbi:unnamed protein product [Miscanthus lutarioriparius]|uniref:Cytochrome P450 n=1 Tax=Miscanthus lutarioriparius TaxID=422564 RepID=A0A811MW66_9POAL|nr:unnamed protein product [Miscanthus lutarioriparius]
MSELLSSFTNDILCRAVAGRSFRVEGRNKVLRELIDAGMAVVGGFNLENFYPRLAKVAGGVLTWPARQSAERLRCRWDNIFDALIDEHAREMAGADGGTDLQDSDFIHVLLSVQEEYGLTRNSIKGILADMFTAGTDTPYLVLEFAMAELMLHQDALAKLQAESSKRHSASISHRRSLFHISLEDCDVDNYMFPAGTTVFINAWAIGRDPKMWNAPEEFMPERFIDSKGDITGADFRGNDFQFLPFGSGRRICPGVNFALALVEIMLANLVYHFDWELPEGVHNVDMTEVFGLAVRRKEKLLLIPRFHPPPLHKRSRSPGGE